MLLCRSRSCCESLKQKPHKSKRAALRSQDLVLGALRLRRPGEAPRLQPRIAELLGHRRTAGVAQRPAQLAHHRRVCAPRSF